MKREDGDSFMKKISVIVPVYNVEKYLPRCVESLLNQTYDNLEIILVDDGSTDDSGKICDDYARKVKKIKTFHKKNGGLSSARNYGILHSSGEFISLIDSDDYVDSSLYEDCMRAFDKDSDILVFNYRKEYDEQPIYDLKVSNKISKHSNIDALNLLLSTSIDNFAWNKIYRKHLFKNVSFPNGKNFEDIGTIYKLFIESRDVIVLENEYYHYVIRDNSITTKLSKKSLLDYIDLVDLRYEDLKKAECDKFLLNGNYCISLYSIYKEAVKFYPKDFGIFNKLKDHHKEFKRNFKFYKKTKQLFNQNFRDELFMCVLYINLNMYVYMMNLWYTLKGR